MTLEYTPELDAKLRDALRPLTVAGQISEALSTNTAKELDAVVTQTRYRRQAKRIIDREDAEAAMRLPPARDDYTLKSYLAEDRPPVEYRVGELQRAGHNALLAARYKTGKTTLACSLARSLVDGGSFLGEFSVKPLRGRIGYWNAEMEERDLTDYLAGVGVKRAERVALWNLRGFGVPLLSDLGAERAVEWLRANEIEYWILDPIGRVCAWSRVNENLNEEVAPLLARIDEIKAATDVRETLLIGHFGRGDVEHIRGATVFDDWADARWIYTRDDEERYFKAEGRGVAVPEGRVTLGDGVSELMYTEGSRREAGGEAKTAGAVDRLVEIVTEDPGLRKTEVQARVGAGWRVWDAAIRRALEQDLVHERREGPAKLLFPGPGGAQPPV